MPRARRGIDILNTYKVQEGNQVSCKEEGGCDWQLICVVKECMTGVWETGSRCILFIVLLYLTTYNLHWYIISEWGWWPEDWTQSIRLLEMLGSSWQDRMWLVGSTLLQDHPLYSKLLWPQHGNVICNLLAYCFNAFWITLSQLVKEIRSGRDSSCPILLASAHFVRFTVPQLSW